MELRKNWEVCIQIENKINRTEEEDYQHDQAYEYVNRHKIDFVVPYTLLIEELKKFMSLIKSEGVWELEEKDSFTKYNHSYDISFVNNKTNKRIEILTGCFVFGKKLEDVKVDLWEGDTWGTISLRYLANNTNNFPVDIDAFADVLWKVIKKKKAIKLLSEQQEINKKVDSLEKKQIKLEKTYFEKKKELDELGDLTDLGIN